MRRCRTLLLAALLLGSPALGMVSCATTPAPDRVVPVSNRDVAELSAEQIVMAMRRAGFTDGQIIRHGPAVRNSLATSGAAQVRGRQLVLAIFAVQGDRLYVSTREHGTFIMELGRDQ